jgi:hypothetical protein
MEEENKTILFPPCWKDEEFAGIGEKLCFVFTNRPDILGTTKPGSDSGEKNCFIGYGKEQLL